jgi:hypothetical protein
MSLKKNKMQNLANVSKKAFVIAIENWLKIKLSEEDERQYVSDLIYSMNESGRGDLLNTFVDMMQYINENSYSYITIILTLILDDDALDFIAQMLEIEYHEIVREMMDILDEKLVIIGIQNIKRIFDDIERLDEEPIRHLYEVASEKGHQAMAEYLHEILLMITKEEVKRPAWVIDPPVMMTNKEMIETISIPKFERWISKSPEEDAKYILSIASEDADLDALYEQVLNKFKTMSDNSRENLITSINNNNKILLLSLDEHIYGVLGPCLVFPGAYDLRNEKDPCSIYGGCRMMTCYENENIDSETGEPIYENVIKGNHFKDLEWFTGQCNNWDCNKKIEKKHYAVRMPIETGGWMGCYCSFKCVKGDIEELNFTRLKLADNFEKMHVSVGIYDRL